MRRGAGWIYHYTVRRTDETNRPIFPLSRGMFMDPGLKDFFRRLLHRAIDSGIASFFWKLPALWTGIIVAILIGVVVYFRLY